jgi:hypothetical protein
MILEKKILLWIIGSAGDVNSRTYIVDKILYSSNHRYYPHPFKVRAKNAWGMGGNSVV